MDEKFAEFAKRLEETLRRLEKPQSFEEDQRGHCTALCNEMGLLLMGKVLRFAGAVSVWVKIPSLYNKGEAESLIIDERGNVFIWGETPADDERASVYAENVEAYDFHLSLLRAERRASTSYRYTT